MREAARELHVARATTLVVAGKLDEALPDFDRAVELDPKDAQTLSNRGWLLQQTGEPKAALKDFDAALRLAPDYGKALANRLALLEALGREQEAARDRAALAELEAR